NSPVDNQPLMVTGPVISHQHNPYGNRCSIYSGVSRVGSDGLCQMRAGLSQTRVDARDPPCQMRATLLARCARPSLARHAWPDTRLSWTGATGPHARTCPSVRFATRPTEIRTDGSAASLCPGD